jgi:membrane protein YdbS with pleckstrin-like domain
MKFKSKIDWWFHLVVWVLFAVTVWTLVIAIQAGNVFTIVIVGVIFVVVDAVFLLPIYLNTYYKLEDESLYIRCGFMRTRVPYGNIESVLETRNPLSSMALSLDRIWVGYKGGEVLISPRDKQEFIRLLKGRVGLEHDASDGGERKPMPKEMKSVLIFAAVTSVVTVIGIGIMFYYGERAPVITVSGNIVKISAMYGEDIDLSKVENITLLEKSMREIGTGGRNNGYGGFGGTLKGHFDSGLLFVEADSSPTIWIERKAGEDVYISFASAAKTRALYEDLAGVWG